MRSKAPATALLATATLFSCKKDKKVEEVSAPVVKEGYTYTIELISHCLL